jgi:thioredoxin-like negative regulator of GroEL
MYETINTLDELTLLLKQKPAVIAYFSTTDCNVCKILKPKVADLIRIEFPKTDLVFIEINSSPELAGQYRVFSVPTLIVFFDGREFFRKSRNFGVDELRREMERPYQLLFS